MANTKTSDESAASALTGSELVRIVQGGSSVRTTAAAIGALGGWGHTLVTATSATLADSNRIVDVDCTAVSAPGTVTLTLPTASAGRVYLIRKIAGAEDETITLDRSGSVEIDFAAADKVLRGSTEPVATGSYYMWPMWIVYSDGTDWYTQAIGNQVLHRKGAAAPSNSEDESIGYLPGSTWCETVQDPGSKLHMQMGTDSGSADWMRIDAVDVVEIDSGDSPYSMPSRDRQIFANTTSGTITLSMFALGDQMAGVQYSITKVNTGTNKITLSFGSSTSVNGSSVTTFDLPGSDDADYGRWHVTYASAAVWVTGGSALT
ncbi:MAG: hypothetical protein IPK80_02755 [Nannocystis sp.]|nr:hypothetical protein [Nannocystis sp.]